MNRICAVALAIWSIPATTCRSADSPDLISVSRQLDQLVEKECASAGLKPLPPCADSEFLRRIWLDLAGRTPPLAEMNRIIAGPKIDREEVVRQLLKSPEFARYWGRIWVEYLTDKRPFGTPEYDGRRLLQFLTDAFRENRPYHELVSELMAGEGSSDVSGSANFLMRYNAEPIPLTGAVSQKFLGLSLQCAECHDHPHARWKQKDFWGLAAHFARLRKMTPTNPEMGEAFFVVIERPRGELIIEDKRAKPNEAGEPPKKTVYPQLPGLPRSDPKRNRRDVLVEWMTSPTNPYLSRHLVNLIWERLLGDKLISNLDQWPPEQPTTETALLNLLADDFAAHDWDLHRLMRIIVLSDVYQRSSVKKLDSERLSQVSVIHGAVAPNIPPVAAVGVAARIRPLSADQLHLSLAQAFGYHFDENDFRLAESTGEEFTQDIPVNNLGPTSLTLGRALALYNTDYVRGAVELGVETATRLYGPAAGAEHIERFFLLLLSRRPTSEELEFFQDLAGESNPAEGLQDVVWVLLNSTEFVTNH